MKSHLSDDEVCLLLKTAEQVLRAVDLEKTVEFSGEGLTELNAKFDNLRLAESLFSIFFKCCGSAFWPKFSKSQSGNGSTAPTRNITRDEDPDPDPTCYNGYIKLYSA